MDYNERLLDTEMKLRDRTDEEVDAIWDLPEEPTLPGEDDELEND
jgi:hypothetical protein